MKRRPIYLRNAPDGVVLPSREHIAARLESLRGEIRVDEGEALSTFVITSPLGERRWQAVDAQHAREQHYDAFPDEEIQRVEREG